MLNASGRLVTRTQEMVPLYRYWKSSINDHSDSTDLSEICEELEIGEYVKDVKFYVFATTLKDSIVLEAELN